MHNLHASKDERSSAESRARTAPQRAESDVRISSGHSAFVRPDPQVASIACFGTTFFQMNFEYTDGAFSFFVRSFAVLPSAEVIGAVALAPFGVRCSIRSLATRNEANIVFHQPILTPCTTKTINRRSNRSPKIAKTKLQCARGQQQRERESGGETNYFFKYERRIVASEITSVH